jgi:uncharacterized protein
MLIQFTIENFLSFKDEATFSMAAGPDPQHADHLSRSGGTSVLSLAAIYGANGAGKSNLIKAIGFAKELIVGGTRGNKRIAITPFRLGGDDRIPSKFEFIFTYKGDLYSYGFKLDREQIFEEWLHVTPEGKKKEVMYFERITSTEKETTIDYGPSLKKRSTKRRQFLDFVGEGTRPNQLFLTEAIDRNVEELAPVMDWFQKALIIIPADAPYSGLELDIMNDELCTEFMSDFLKNSGTGINSVITEEIDLDLEGDLRGIPQELIQRMKAEDTSAMMIGDSHAERALFLKDNDGQFKIVRLKTQHQDENGSLIEFELREESDGTQRLINLVPALFLLQQESEAVLLIDELDRRLHPLLARHFLEMAISCRDKSNQLIFTTHDTNLLDLDLLRRDEVWFIEKNRRGISTLYSLAEFKVRPDLKTEKGYLNGRFGAIPFFGDPERLGWVQSAPDVTGVPA